LSAIGCLTFEDLMAQADLLCSKMKSRAEGGVLRSKYFGFLFFATLLLMSVSAVGQSNSSQAAPPPPQNGGDFSQNPNAEKLPTGVILTKGSWSSATDSVTPLPEGGSVAVSVTQLPQGGSVTNSVYNNEYFGLSYAFSANWTEKYKGPPPSDSGFYVLSQVRPADTFKGPSKGSILIGAQDLFFSLAPAGNALDLINNVKDNLKPDYKVERPPTEVKIGNHSFTQFDYVAPVADLHWYILATQIRCHMVEFVLTSRDTKLLEALIQDMNKMKLPAEAGVTAGTGGGDVPVCIKDYADSGNLIERVEPAFTEHKFNAVPVRIIIDKEGRVKHIHFLSAFPDQAKAITDAVLQWSFKPYRRNGEPAEVETGIMFGLVQRPKTQPGTPTATD